MCYEIGVGGFGSEGDYVLSISCTVVNATAIPVACGSLVTGSTVGLPSLRGSRSGDQRHIFCPNTIRNGPSQYLRFQFRHRASTSTAQILMILLMTLDLEMVSAEGRKKSDSMSKLENAMTLLWVDTAIVKEPTRCRSIASTA